MISEALKVEAFRLSPAAHWYLAKELLASSDAMRLAKTEKLRIDKAIRNDEDRDARAFPADEVLSRASFAGLSRLVSIRYS